VVTVAPHVHRYIEIASSLALAIIVVGVSWLAWLVSRIRKTDKQREAARAELERLARSLGSGSGRGGS